MSEPIIARPLTETEFNRMMLQNFAYKPNAVGVPQPVYRHEIAKLLEAIAHLEVRVTELERPRAAPTAPADASAASPGTIAAPTD